MRRLCVLMLLGAVSCTTSALSTTSVQQAAVTACGFLPAAETVAAIIATNNPALATTEAIANAICNAVRPPASASRLSASPMPIVSGVVIKGNFVNSAIRR